MFDSRRLFLTLVLLLATGLPSLTRGECPIGPSVYRWCPSDYVLNIMVYWDGQLRVEGDVRTEIVVALEWWSYKFMEYDIDTRLIFQTQEDELPEGYLPGSSGTPEIVFKYECISNFLHNDSSCDTNYVYTGCIDPVPVCDGNWEPSAATGLGGIIRYNAIKTDNVAIMQGACVVINSAAPWHAVDRSTTILHEIGHVLGLGDMNIEAADDPTATCGTELMYGQHCDARTIDAHAMTTAACIYGQTDWLGDPLPAIPRQYAIFPGMAVDTGTGNRVPIMEGWCDRTRAPCSSSKALRTGLRYDLAVSERDPLSFELFASLTDEDWVAGTYEHEFITDYDAAVFRMKVYDGTTLLDEAYSGDPIKITSGATGMPFLSTDRNVVQVLDNPSSVGQVQISYRAVMGASYQLNVYDLRGRLVRSLRTGIADGEVGRLTWNGSGEDGQRVPAGVYLIRLKSRDCTATARAVLLQ